MDSVRLLNSTHSVRLYTESQHSLIGAHLVSENEHHKPRLNTRDFCPWVGRIVNGLTIRTKILPLAKKYYLLSFQHHEMKLCKFILKFDCYWRPTELMTKIIDDDPSPSP